MTYDFARDVLQYSGLRLNPRTPQPVIMQGVPFNIRALPWDPIMIMLGRDVLQYSGLGLNTGTSQDMIMLRTSFNSLVLGLNPSTP